MIDTIGLFRPIIDAVLEVDSIETQVCIAAVLWRRVLCQLLHSLFSVCVRIFLLHAEVLFSLVYDFSYYFFRISDNRMSQLFVQKYWFDSSRAQDRVCSLFCIEWP